MDKYFIDGTKIQHHLERLIQWRNAKSIQEKLLIYPIYVEVSPVGHCSHRCLFCAVDYIGYIPRELDKYKLKDTIGQMSNLGVKSIMFAGEGEPLLYRNLAEVINFTRMSNIDVAVTTNGVLMHEAFVTNCLDSISWIKISVNGGDEETYNHVHQAKKGDWKTLWENITFATSYRNIQGLQTAIGIQIVVIPENVESLEDLLLESKLAGVDYVVIKPYSQHLSSMETAKKYSGLEYNSGETFAKLKEKFEDETFSIVVRNNAIAETGHSYDRCYSTPNFWAYLMSNGDLYSCSAYLLDNRFNLGNINESTFQAIWEGEKRKKNIELVENHLDINECRVNCRMNQVNKYLWELKNPPSHLSFI